MHTAVKVALAATLLPFAIVLSPIVLFAYSTLVFVNVGRAGEWSFRRMAAIARRFVEECLFILSVLSLFKGVVWGYVTNSKDAGRLRAKKNVEYERFLEEDLAKAGKSLVSVPKDRKDRITFRNNQMKLDVFPLMPVSGVRAGNHKVRPVIVFVYGGYFDSGDKFIYNRLARQLRDHCNAVVVVPNYPTYPRGTIQEMSESIARCLMWTSENAEKYGGSREHIWVVGHSAGAYLTSYVILRSMMAKASGSNALPPQLMAQGDFTAPIYPLSISRESSRYVGCKTHANTHCNDAAAQKGGGGEGAHQTKRMPNPSAPAVDFRLVPRVSGCVLFASVYDLSEQFKMQRSVAMERTSSMAAATGGYWDATNVIALCRAMADDCEAFPLQTNVCPANGFHIVHGTGDTTCPVKQSLNLRDALIDLQTAQNERLRRLAALNTNSSNNSSNSLRLTPTPPELQTPFGGSFARAQALPAGLSSGVGGIQNNNCDEDYRSLNEGGDLASPNAPSPNANAAAPPFSASPSPASDARAPQPLINLCPHGVRHTECSHRDIVLEPMRMTAHEIPSRSSTIGAVFSAIYGRPMILPPSE